MSVTFASGIIPTSTINRFVISISRFSVRTKYRRHQVRRFQACRRNTTPHRIQTAATSKLPPAGVTQLTRPAPARLSRIRLTGRMVATGCIRTLRTTFSVFMRYSPTTLEGRVRTLITRSYTRSQ
jgi:hypothetical protein